MPQILQEPLPEGLIGGLQYPVGVVVHEVAQPVGDKGLDKVFFRRVHVARKGAPLVLVDRHVEKIEKGQRVAEWLPEDRRHKQGDSRGGCGGPPGVQDRLCLDEGRVHGVGELDVKVVKDGLFIVLGELDGPFNVLVGHVLAVVDKDEPTALQEFRVDLFVVGSFLFVLFVFLLEFFFEFDNEFGNGRSTRLVEVKVHQDSSLAHIGKFRNEHVALWVAAGVFFCCCCLLGLGVGRRCGLGFDTVSATVAVAVVAVAVVAVTAGVSLAGRCIAGRSLFRLVGERAQGLY
mmetsp:Transcript_8460/g.25034  ORF Transcript_8460/g.25034 Transcript_8460/m.25034 type:complete len:289 (-) Transcript_8460:398-1264(-)